MTGERQRRGPARRNNFFRVRPSRFGGAEEPEVAGTGRGGENKNCTKTSFFCTVSETYFLPVKPERPVHPTSSYTCTIPEKNYVQVSWRAMDSNCGGARETMSKPYEKTGKKTES